MIANGEYTKRELPMPKRQDPAGSHLGSPAKSDEYIGALADRVIAIGLAVGRNEMGADGARIFNASSVNTRRVLEVGVLSCCCVACLLGRCRTCCPRESRPRVNVFDLSGDLSFVRSGKMRKWCRDQIGIRGRRR